MKTEIIFYILLLGVLIFIAYYFYGAYKKDTVIQTVHPKCAVWVNAGGIWICKK